MSPNSFRATDFLCASATGVKYRPMVGFAGAPEGQVHRELWCDKAYDWDDAHYTVQCNAYCDAQVMQEWIEEVWRPSVEGTSVLLLDSLKVHRMQSVQRALKDCHMRLEFVPPGVTGLCQPMDVSVIHPFKTRCRALYLQHNRDDGFCATHREHRKRIVAIVTRAWCDVSSECIAEGFDSARLVCTTERDENGSVSLDAPPPDSLNE